MILLKGKRAVITGGTSGIGKEIALCLAEAGALVAILGTNQERGEEVVAQLKAVAQEKGMAAEQHFFFIPTNLSESAQVIQAAGQISSQWECVDILVNNAGITRDGLLLRMSEEDWDLVLNTNLKSAFLLTKLLLKGMVKARQGKIINIASVVGVVGNPGQANYVASKAGLIGFTKALALEVATRNICVNCIAPGFIKTRMTDVLTEEQKKSILTRIPCQKMGSPQDIAHAVLFLASTLSDYITGQVLRVDGGMVTA